jgi:hypothetical protein
MIPFDNSRRSFLRTSVAFAGTTVLTDGLLQAQSGEAAGPLVAYVGTFSSPLRDVLRTQVDLPPGNGRGIHLFRVDRATGAMTPAGIHETGTSPSCLALNAAGTRLYSANETDRVGEEKEGTVSAFAIDRRTEAELLNTVRSGGAGPTFVAVHPSGRFVLVANYFGARRGAADSARRPSGRRHRHRTMPARSAPPGGQRPRAALPSADTIGLTRT